MNFKAILLLFVVSITTNAQVTKDQLHLMPWPKAIHLSEGNFTLNKDFKINISGIGNKRIYNGATRFLRRLDERTGLFFNQGFITKNNEFPNASLQISCNRNGTMDINQDESYILEVLNNKILIKAETDLGALHALETLLQLLQNNATTHYFPNVSIKDTPRFTWRGLMIDAARHFQPIDVIKRNLDAMAAVKLNVFHWHLVDDQGWRIEIKKHPEFTEKASDGLFYTQEEIKEIVKYADARGILVMPEIDVPGHGSAILTAFPEIGSKYTPDGKPYNYSIERNAGIFTPTLDPTNPKTYQLLSDIFDEVCPLFSGKYFHIGGDENEGKDWDSNPKIQEFKKQMNLKTNHDLQTYFNIKLLPMLKKHQKIMMGWEEIMTSDMPKEAIIHSWKGDNEGMKAGESLVNAAKNGYQTVLSNGFYIDLVQSVRDHYLNPIVSKEKQLTEDERKRILGGEATMWSELVSPLTIDSRIWPRTAAIAERLWSDEKINDVQSMYRRLESISHDLEMMGIQHLRNKEVILRNITNYQDTKALNDFAAICEPIKIYSRNKGGTEYQMYSPLTLFADACTPDAPDAIAFAIVVENYLVGKNETHLQSIKDYLNKWIATSEGMLLLSKNAPLMQPILPLSKNLAELSKKILEGISDKSKVNTQEINQLLENCNSKDNADVELAIYPSLKKIVEHFSLK